MLYSKELSWFMIELNYSSVYPLKRQVIILHGAQFLQIVWAQTVESSSKQISIYGAIHK